MTGPRDGQAGTGRPAAIVSLLLVMVVWGSSFAVTKAALDQVPPMLLALLRFAVASAILVPLAWTRGGTAVVSQPLPLGTLALMGLSGVTVYFVGFNLALTFTTASEGAVIQSAIPVVSAILAAVVLRERLDPLRSLGIGLSILGVGMVVLVDGGDGTAPNRLLGDALMGVSVLAWAAYTVLGRRLRAVSGLTVTAASTLLGTVFLLPPVAYEIATHPLRMPPAAGWLAVLYLGAVASALAFLLWNRAVATLGVGQAATFINLVPLVGVVSAALFLGEPLVGSHVVGGALILTGVALCAR